MKWYKYILSHHKGLILNKREYFKAKIKELHVYHLYHNTCHYLLLYNNDTNRVASL